MASRDGLIKTDTLGVFYREHPSRKHGVRKDRQWVIRQTLGGETKISTFGWSALAKLQKDNIQDKIDYSVNSYGDACNKSAEYKENFKWNKSNPDKNHLPACKEDEDLLAQEKEVLAQAKQREEIRRETTFEQFFNDTYFPQCEIDKSKSSAGNEELLFRNWIKPVIGNLLFDQISIDHLDKIKANMLSGKRPAAKKHGRDRKPEAKDAHLRRNAAKPMSARSIQYALAVIRQVWNRACASNPPLAYGAWPGASKAFKKPKADNQRKRFLTRNEAALLLSALKVKSQDLHDMALLALHCGLRAEKSFP
jgi:hypothetical protein